MRILHTLPRRLLSGLLAVFAAAAAALPLTACHGTKGLPEFTMPAAFDESKPYELTFWAKNDTNLAQTKIYEKAISDFEALYPNITVTMRLYTDYSRIYNDVITNIATATTPNICITYPDHIATYKTGGNNVVPLDDLAADAQYGLGGAALKFESPTEAEVIPQFLEECRIDGALYALPYMRSTEACYINQDYVEALGYTLPDVLTWDFVWEVAEAATKKNADGTFALNGQNIMIPFIYKSTDNMMIQMLRQKNAGYSDAAGSIEIFNDTTRELLNTVAEHTATDAFSTFKVSSYPANFLDAGQCVFAIDSTAGATWMGAHAPLSDISADKFVEFETAVRPVPQFDADHPQMISQGPSVCVFNKADSGEVLASWLFAQYLLTNSVQIAYAETEGYVPVTSKAQGSADYQSYLAAGGSDNNAHYSVKIEAAQLLLDHTGNTFVTPVFNGSASLRGAAGQLVENTVKSVNRGETIDADYFARMFAQVTSLYRLDRTAADTGVGGHKDLGPMPAASVALLTVLAVAWVCILGYLAVQGVAAHKRRKKSARKVNNWLQNRENH